MLTVCKIGHLVGMGVLLATVWINLAQTSAKIVRVFTSFFKTSTSTNYPTVALGLSLSLCLGLDTRTTV